MVDAHSTVESPVAAKVAGRLRIAGRTNPDGIVRPMFGHGSTASVDEEPYPEAAARRRLTRAWGWWCVAGVAGLAVGLILLHPAFGAKVIRWLVPNLLALAAVLAFVRSNLQRNRRSDDGPLLGELGAGNHATILRGVLLAQLPGYLFLPWPAGPQAWLPALTFTAVLVADYLDGYLARRAEWVTRLGEALDIEFDGTGLLAATALAVHYGQLPLVYLLTVGSARYIYLLAGWTAQQLGHLLHALPPSNTRRALAGTTMEIGAAALWPIVPPVMMTLAGAIVAVPFLAGFLRDGLVHLGFLDPASASYVSARRRIVTVSTFVLPPFLRVILLLLLGPSLIMAAQSLTSSASVVDPVVPASRDALEVAALLFIALCLLLVVFGFAGRIGAAGLFIVYGLGLATIGVTPRGLAAWGCAFAIYLLGTGAGSLWQPERALYLRRAGERG